MDVKNSVNISLSQEIQWGYSSYNSTLTRAIRVYYKSANGGFNPKSPEVFWSDFLLMIEKSIEQKEFTPAEIQNILNNISTHYI